MSNVENPQTNALAEEKSFKVDTRFVCKPLDCYSEVLLFLENPPPWRTLCKELIPHSDKVIRNKEINTHSIYHTLEKPEVFCHFDPDGDEVKRHESKMLPKTLLCHDMANGYHDDCLIDGSSKYDAYTFYNWAGIDIFCYFSHHLVTIPPVGWINVAHAHGVKVIGTIITEWAEGITFWDDVLVSETQYRNVASALVAIAKTLKFDGYLLNIENKINKPDVLVEFVRYLHQLVHEELPHGILIWYDSVTVQGNLNWQNGLNDKNKVFFDVCDGFFTNYSWSVEDVKSSAELAADRLTDLYIGVDVWGRNFYGGGQFNTQSAIKVVHAAGCSIALFAPAWTHEALVADKPDENNVVLADELSPYKKYLLRDRAFWGSIWPFLNTRVPCHLPFQTSFCRGQGKKRCLYGEVLSPSPWYNLRHQQYQPNSAHGPHGYLLTSVDQLAKVQRHAQYKDKKGIIRMRASFQQSRHELHSVSKEAANLRSGFDSGTGPRAASSRRADDTSSESSSDTDAIISNMKNKVKSLKEMFKQKVSTASGTEEPSPVQTRASSAASSVGTTASQDLSMVQMSVNIRLGQSDKSRYCLGFVGEERECLELFHADCFSGGACLKVNPSDNICTEHRITRLLYCDFACEEALVVCVVTKPLQQYAEQTLNVKLAMRNANGDDLCVVLTGRALKQSTRLDARAAGIKHVYPHASAAALADLRAYLLLTQPGFYVPIDNLFGWNVRYYEVTVPGSRITAINLRTGLPQGGILLGHLGICHKTSRAWNSGTSSRRDTGFTV
uniref:Cytosolic endo-beta-N-acetylglucosaminidase TIM barrel domain-containing protein n=1 Tax=Heliothis virescens TaxID=7102 RepID=A0A2A4JGP6_HELVI